MSAISLQLQQLCQSYDINTSYRDMNGIAREVSEETLLAILPSLGAAVHKSEDFQAAHRLKHLRDWQSISPPVIVFWEGSSPVINLRLPNYLLDASLPVSLYLESGELLESLWKIEPFNVIEQKNVEGSVYLVARFTLPQYLPFGYHKLKVELPGQEFESLIISAPLHAHISNDAKTKKWGAFLPLYALHSSRSWGAGDYTDLREFMRWISESGGEAVGTLPLLAGFFDNKFGPGPYLPASKVFWNEFYLDISDIPEFSRSSEAQRVFNSGDFQSELALLRKSSNVLYDTELRLKRQILEILSSQFWTEKSSRFVEFEMFLTDHPSFLEYANFRAAGEAYGLDWRKWSEKLPKLNVDENSRNYHAYVQWLATQQIKALNVQAGNSKTLLYMDLPVGIHPSSYDIWKEPESFVSGIDCGAPPDPVFTNGQNWGFPPLHPENIRRGGYQYFIQSLRHQLNSCGMLRLDHMMGFHRIFCIPQGMPNTAGTYVNYRAEEFYAILTLESFRHKSIIIGEDLGLVPPEVRPMMDKHAIYRMFVGQFELISDNKLGIIQPNSVASLNTHDMFPFAAFWEEADISQRQKIKLIDETSARAELDQRRATKRALISVLQYKGLENDFHLDTAATLVAIIRILAESPAETVLINLEDLWLEQKPQNIPGTVRPQNWTHKARYSFEQFTKLPVVVQLLKEIDSGRKGDQPKH
jgi:4-alpha-glucanotransferase